LITGDIKANFSNKLQRMHTPDMSLKENIAVNRKETEEDSAGEIKQSELINASPEDKMMMSSEKPRKHKKDSHKSKEKNKKFEPVENEKEFTPSTSRYKVTKSDSSAGSSGEITKITLIATNDMHGMFESSKGLGGFANLAGTINQIREGKKHCLVMDVGDVAYNPPYSEKNRFSPITDIMNKMGYTVASPGNHQYQWESKRFGGVYGNPNPELVDNLFEMSKALNFPLVNCNTVLKQDGKRPDFLKPFIILDFNGIKVGVTGVCTTSMATKAHPYVAEDWKVISPAAALKETIPQMKQAGADLVIVLGHEGTGKSKDIIEKTPGIDLFFAAHDHDTTNQPLMITDPTGKKVPLTEGASHTKYVSEMEVSVDSGSKKVTDISFTLHPVKGGANKADPEIAKIVEKWKKK
jgi:2',3'-cyclic-nucleotide 2'-phosphodiesterase/3'-nucleotidase